MVSQQEQINFFEQLNDVRRKLKTKKLYLFLDYDGTLTPIVDHPDKAIISESMRVLVQDVSQNIPVSIVSGRATDDVRSKVGIPDLYYAGSHGFEIYQSDENITIHPKARALRSVIEDVFRELTEKTKDISGALVEDVKYTISVHYRQAADQDAERIKNMVDETVKNKPDLRTTHGKKVVEVRPKIDWDKGKAVQWILEKLSFDQVHNLAVYIGDDTTDEDAFRVVNKCGFSLLVADHAKPSQAVYQVKDVPEVQRVLEFFKEETA